MTGAIIGDLAAWLYDTEKEVDHATRLYSLKMDKEDWYASHFMAKLIFSLRNGATKKEAALVEHLFWGIILTLCISFI